MKKAILVLVILALVPLANAQDLKLIMGPVVSNYSSQWPNVFFPDWQGETSTLNPFDNHKTGIAWGFGIEFPIRKSIALEIDGLFFEKGCIFKYYGMAFTSFKVEYELRGLSIPVLLKARLFPRPFPYFLAGMDLSFVLSHERKSLLAPEASLIYEEIGREDLEDETRGIDLGSVLGIGFEVPLNKGALSLEGRYQLGLTNLANGYNEVRARTRALVVVVGYKI